MYFHLVFLLFSIVSHFTTGEQHSVRSKRDLIQLAGMIRFTTNNPPLLYNDYGNFCGWGSRPEGKVNDNIDSCCFDHDNCYSVANHGSCSESIIYAYFTRYSWSTKGNQIICTDSTECRKFLCTCDKTLAECLARHPYNAKLKRPSLLDLFMHKV